MVLRLVLLGVLSLAASAPAASRAADVPANDNLMATLWALRAAEYDGVTRTVYAAATNALEAALADPSVTAATEQVDADFADLPPAVILDVDETVLDNVEYQARLILDDAVYESESWTAWCEERAAVPVPGSLEFCQRAAARGVTVFYVTNRRSHLEQSTFDNLQALGYPVTMETLIMRGEREEWAPSDKTPRRAHVAATHRVVLMFGDNLGDFVDIEDLDVAARDERVAAYGAWWGQRWFMLPNPMYGSWDAALIDGAFGESAAWKAERKRAWLEVPAED